MNLGEPRLVKHRDSILHTAVSERWYETSIIKTPEDMQEFGNWIGKALDNFDCYGIAAPQLGYDVRCFAIKTEPKPTICFDPVITWFSEEKVQLEEGCLSFPGIFVKKWRSKHINFSYFDENGDKQDKVYTGMSARIVQHETDHLNGKLFFQEASNLEKLLSIKKAKKLGHSYLIGDLR